MKKILLLTMGGTIDAEAYPVAEEDYPVNATPSGSNASFETLSDILKSCSWTLDQTAICDKDSKEYNETDRQTLLGAVLENNDSYDRIIITCGTDRMTETALWLRDQLIKSDFSCPVVFTGAIWPLANGPEKSDGYKNLERAALFAERTLHNDVYITVGNIFMFPENIIKDFEGKQFVFQHKV